MAEAPIFAELAHRDKVIGILHDVLARHGMQVDLNRMDIHLSDKVIIESFAKGAYLSEAVLNYMFPHEPAPCTLYHYTSLEGIEGIVQSGELRLYPVRKRLGQGGELDAFAKAHGLLGYLNVSEDEAFYKTLSDDLFYISMTRVPPKDPYLMWGAFAKGTGVRLEFQVQPKVAELRPIRYEQDNSTTLLTEINQALEYAGEPPFNPWTISKIGAFYLDSTVKSEDEVRLLLKRHVGGIDMTRSDDSSRYWPIPIGEENEFCQVELTGVHIAPSGDRSAIETILRRTRFSTVPITEP
ncbi:hypothetical protein GOC94_30945 [Sinorhizobium medicae]|nr:hypothetical protein [Sinorhizobium medicae]